MSNGQGPVAAKAADQRNKEERPPRRSYPRIPCVNCGAHVGQVRVICDHCGTWQPVKPREKQK